LFLGRSQLSFLREAPLYSRAATPEDGNDLARTRFAELVKVFRAGQSELLNGIARLAILYEDLRLEIREFKTIHRSVIELGEPDWDYRLSYFLRRSLATLVEFRGALTVVKRTEEFKKARPGLSALDAKLIAEADKFLQQHWPRIKELRNEFAGHISADAVDFALKNLTNEVGKVTWNPGSDTWTGGVECDFAGVVVAGVISSKLQDGGDVRAELRKALDIMSQGFNHAQAAMVALVHAFLWDRFGK
jgi:hypothetical protein